MDGETQTNEELQKYVEFLEAKLAKQQMSLTMKDMVIEELCKHIPESEMQNIGEHIKIEAPAA